MDWEPKYCEWCGGLLNPGMAAVTPEDEAALCSCDRCRGCQKMKAAIEKLRVELKEVTDQRNSAYAQLEWMEEIDENEYFLPVEAMAEKTHEAFSTVYEATLDMRVQLEPDQEHIATMGGKECSLIGFKEEE